MDMDKLKTMRNLGNPFAAYTGIETTAIDTGYAEALMTVRTEHLNPLGYVHGGCIYTMADIVSGSAVASYGYQAVTASGEYHYFSPAVNTKTLYATARTIKKGRALAITEVEISDDRGKLIGKGTFTHSILKSEVQI